MSATDLRTIKAFLLEQKGSILNKNSEFKNEQSSERGHFSDEAEAASQDFSQSISIQLHERERQALLEVEKALSKIEDGSYGDCESCGEKIGVKRLQARPFAHLCVHCKEEQEDPRNYMN